MRVTLLQLDVDLAEERDARVSRVCEMIATQSGADLVVLPEVWSTGYFAFDRYAATAEPVDGPTSRALADAARSASVHLHAGSIVERAPDGSLHNTSLLFSPTGDLVHTQRKFHVFGYRSREAELLRGGLVIAGYTARDQAAVERHIAELAAVSVPAPPSVPAYYPVPVELLRVSEEIAVTSPESSGEVEPVLFCTDRGWYVGVGSATARSTPLIPARAGIPVRMSPCPPDHRKQYEQA